MNRKRAERFIRKYRSPNDDERSIEYKIQRVLDEGTGKPDPDKWIARAAEVVRFIRKVEFHAVLLDTDERELLTALRAHLEVMRNKAVDACRDNDWLDQIIALATTDSGLVRWNTSYSDQLHIDPDYDPNVREEADN